MNLNALKQIAIDAGRALIGNAVLLWLASTNNKTPAWAKAIAVSGLIYLINPFDAIPDPTPIIGYGDDAGILTVALAQIAAYIDAQTRAQAADLLRRWFG
ncbi:DUF1232 domain-containing protein [Myxococcota bacterium]|nr:DUF1232 domain-containing protein [Myxococcota bacterium]MBU1898335.1 DUF1232 domain-containing protein [Myxococcota bacterium]